MEIPAELRQAFIDPDPLVVQVPEIEYPVPLRLHIGLHTEFKVLKGSPDPFPRAIDQSLNPLPQDRFISFLQMPAHAVEGIFIFQDQQLLGHVPGVGIVRKRLRSPVHIQKIQFQPAALQNLFSLLPGQKFFPVPDLEAALIDRFLMLQKLPPFFQIGVQQQDPFPVLLVDRKVI